MTPFIATLGFLLTTTARFGVDNPVPSPLLGPYSDVDRACTAVADPAVQYVGSDPCRTETFAMPAASSGSAILEARGLWAKGGPVHLALRTARGWFVEKTSGTMPKSIQRLPGGAAEGELVVLTEELSLQIGNQGACFSDDRVLDERYHIVCAVGRSGVPACARLPDHLAVVTDRGRKEVCSRTPATPRAATTTEHARRDVRFAGRGVIEMTAPRRTWTLAF
jgi:hypothetical protein